MQAVKNYLSLIKFSHTIFAMPFAMIGFVLGWAVVDPLLVGSIFGGIGRWSTNKSHELKYDRKYKQQFYRISVAYGSSLYDPCPKCSNGLQPLPGQTV